MLIFTQKDFEIKAQAPNIIISSTYDKLQMNPNSIIYSFYFKANQKDCAIFKHVATYKIKDMVIYKYESTKYAVLVDGIATPGGQLPLPLFGEIIKHITKL